MSDAPLTYLVILIHQWPDQLEQSETSARMSLTMFGSHVLTVENLSSAKVLRSTRPLANQPRTVRKTSRSITAVSKARCAMVSVLTYIYNTDLIGSTARLRVGNLHEQRPMNIGGGGGSHMAPPRIVTAEDKHLVNTSNEGGFFIF